jgi:hypothetical protein
VVLATTRFQGDDGRDLLFGGEGHDRLASGAGDDEVLGGDGNDILVAGAGLDRLHGQAGDDRLVLDVLEGGRGTELVDGGGGKDRLELHLSADVAGSAAFQADLTSLENRIGQGGSYAFRLKSLGLVVQNVEQVELIVT